MYRPLAFAVGFAVLFSTFAAEGAPSYKTKPQRRHDAAGVSDSEKLPVRLSDLEEKLKCHKYVPSPYPNVSSGNPSRRPINRTSQLCAE